MTTAMTWHRALALRAEFQERARDLARKNADTRLPFGTRYAAAVYRDHAEQVVEDCERYLRHTGRLTGSDGQ